MTGKRILIAPLDWGLGHAARCVPVIRHLLSAGHEVIVAADNRPASFLKNEFPFLEHVKLPGFKVKYSTRGFSPYHFLLRSPSIAFHLLNEKKLTAELTRRFNTDLIISDNRYGVYSEKIPSVIITHQLTLKTNFASASLNAINKKLISRFNYCLVPDTGKGTYAGDLSSASLGEMVRYLGSLSRFEKLDLPKTISFLAVISGPEPQRTVFEKKVISFLERQDGKRILVRGLSGYGRSGMNGIECYDNLSSEELNAMICSSQVIVGRSGYSTIMDLAATGSKSLMVPTPGQTEQEYLAGYHGNLNHCAVCPQEDFTPSAFDGKKVIKGFPVVTKDHYKKELDKLIQEIT